MTGKEIIKQWYYSVCLLIIYIISFHIWGLFQNRMVFLVSGIVTVSLASVFLYLANRQNYFINRIDLSAHILVIIDLALEALLYELAKGLFKLDKQDIFLFHNNYSFYYCALAFALVIGLYRYRQLNMRTTREPASL